MKGIYRFINTGVPVTGCNLRCEYCYIRQQGNEDTLRISPNRNDFFRYTTEHMLRALSVERMGGTCMFNLCGSGETLLCPDIFEIVSGLLAMGHYVTIVSNCTITNQIVNLTEMPAELKERLFFKASLHYRELKRRGLLSLFAENFRMLRESHIATTMEIVTHDGVLDELDELKAYCMENFGALPHLMAGRDETTPGRYPKFETKLSENEFYQTWASFDSDLFAYQYTDYTVSHQNSFCYAGEYAGGLDLGTGRYFPCPSAKTMTNLYEDIERPIKFAPVGRACPFPYCMLGHAMMVLAGSCRDYHPDVKFYQFRDRTCADGTHWLTPSIREVFSHQCSEFHEQFSETKEFYLSALMRKSYLGKDPSPEDLDRLAQIVSAYCNQRGIHKVAIYGMGGLGSWLLNILEGTDIEAVCGLDQRYESITSSIPLLGPDETVEDADAVIVSVYYEFTNIAPRLRKTQKASILSITEIAD